MKNLKLFSLIFGLFAVAGVGLAKPHVLFISIDDMNDCLYKEMVLLGGQRGHHAEVKVD